MIQEGKFGVNEAVCLVTITISSKVFFSSPGLLTKTVGSTGWYMTLISNATAILAFAFICQLLKRFPGKDIVEIFELSMGRIIGFVFSFIFAGAFLQSSSILLREFSDVLKVFILPETSLNYIIVICVIAAVVSAYLGLESIARVSRLFGYAALLMYMVLLILASTKFDSSNLFPILGYGIDRTVITGIKRSSAYSEVLVIAVFAGSLQGINHIKKAGYTSLIISGLVISIGLLCFLLVFPYSVNQELVAPIYVMVRVITFGSFVQRLDPLFLFLWNLVTFITISVLFYSSLSVYCKMFRLQDMKPIIIPMAVLLYTLAIWPEDLPSVIEGSVQTAREYGWVIFYVLPITTLITALLRKKKGEN